MASPIAKRSVLNAWYSSRPPLKLRLIAAFFAVNGVVELLMAAAAFYYSFTWQIGPLQAFTVVALRAFIAALWLNAARLLWQRKQQGGLWAAAILALITVDWLLWDQRKPSFSVVVMLLTVALILLSWRDLEP